MSTAMPTTEQPGPATETPDGVTRVIVTHGMVLPRAAWVAGVNAQTDLVVAGHAGNTDEVLALLAQGGADVVVVDAGLPPVDGVHTCAAIREQGHSVRVLVVGEQPDDRQLMAAVEAGADGYATADRPLAEVLEDARAIARGEARVPPRMLSVLLRRLIDGNRARDEARRRIARLSKRERQVLSLLTEGRQPSDIAEDLAISPETVRTHVQNVMSKLEVHSRLEATALVVEHRLTSLLDTTGAAPAGNGAETAEKEHA